MGAVAVLCLVKSVLLLGSYKGGVLLERKNFSVPFKVLLVGLVDTRQINRKTNSFITCIFPIYMGETWEDQVTT